MAGVAVPALVYVLVVGASGANLITALGVAGDSTIAGAITAARKHDKGVVFDLIGVPDKDERDRQVVALGAVFVEMHGGLDEQAEDGYSLETLLMAGAASEVPFSVAGGVGVDSVEAVQNAEAQVAVAGSTIYSAPDVAATASAIRANIR